jgi:hypothetical protein
VRIDQRHHESTQLRNADNGNVSLLLDYRGAMNWRAATLIVGLFCIVSAAARADNTQGTSCTAPATAGISGSTNGASLVQPAGGNNLVCVSGTWQYPSYQFGDSTATCNSGAAGAVRWHSSAIQYCNGSSWGALGGGSTFAAGLVAAPGWAVTTDLSTGLYQATIGTLSVTAEGTEAARFLTTASAVDYLTLTGTTTGNAATGPILSVAGTDTNVGLKLNTKGTGALTLATTGSGNINLSPSSGDTIVTAGNVGMGTTAPTRALDVAASVIHSTNGAASQIAVRSPTSPTNKLNLGYDTTSNYGFIEAVNESVAWENLALQPLGGYVGIGTTTPAANLEVRITANENLSIRNSTSNTVELLAENDGNTAYEPFFINGLPLVLNAIGSGSVGIGTTTPQSKLDVAGGTSIGTGYAGMTAAPSNGAIVQGNVGIGTTMPNTKLDISDTTSISTFTGIDNQGVRIGGAGNGKYSLLQFKGQNAFPIAQIGALENDTLGTYLQFGTSNNYNGTAGITNIAMTIDPSGNVGIGSTSPGGILDVERVNSDGGVILQVGDKGCSSCNFDFSRDSTNGSLHIQGNQTGSTNIALAPMGGNVGIGTTSPAYALDIVGSTAQALRLAGTTNDNTQLVFAGHTNGNLWYIGPDIASGGITGDFEFYNVGNDGGTVGAKLTILGSGNVGIGTALPNATLDVSGFVRLALNSSAPATCSGSNEGAVALTHLAQACVCDTTPAWHILNTSTACSW